VRAWSSIQSQSLQCVRAWSDHISLVPGHLYSHNLFSACVPGHLYSHNLFSACVPGLQLQCFRSVQFFKTEILQGSVATQLRCGRILNTFYCKFPAECNSERILKIG